MSTSNKTKYCFDRDVRALGILELAICLGSQRHMWIIVADRIHIESVNEKLYFLPLGRNKLKIAESWEHSAMV